MYRCDVDLMSLGYCFFFKQKTAYEIDCDWSSDVCSSDLNGFVVESFIDELANAAKKDPYEYRRDLLGKAPRHLRVLNLAASKAGWGTPLPAGRSRGIAVYKSFDSYVAEVAEVSVGSDGAPRVHRVVCAVDCGPVV